MKTNKFLAIISFLIFASSFLVSSAYAQESSNTCVAAGGACFGGLQNCGQVGRPPGVGTCPNAGELCCAPPPDSGNQTPQFCGISLPPSGFTLQVPQGTVGRMNIAINPGVSSVETVNVHTMEQITGNTSDPVAMSVQTNLGGQAPDTSEQIFRTAALISGEKQGSSTVRVWARCRNGVTNQRFYSVVVTDSLPACQTPTNIKARAVYNCTATNTALEYYVWSWTPISEPKGFDVQYRVELFRQSDDVKVRDSNWRYPDSFGVGCFYGTSDCIWSTNWILKDNYYLVISVRDMRENKTCGVGSVRSETFWCTTPPPSEGMCKPLSFTIN